MASFESEENRNESLLCEKLSVHSYGMVELPQTLQTHLRELYIIAESFFLSTDSSVSSELFEKFRVLQTLPSGGIKLFGYTQPSEYKSLFRYYRHSKSSMKWPSEEFKLAVEKCEIEIRSYIEDQFNQVALSIFPKTIEGKAVTYQSLCEANSRIASVEEDIDQIGLKLNTDDDICPFDIFFYPNRANNVEKKLSQEGKATERNCESHLDRGLMHIIVSNTPGLEVLDHASKQWTSVHLQNPSSDGQALKKCKLDSINRKVRTKDADCSHGVILVNSTLQDLTMSGNNAAQNGSSMVDENSEDISMVASERTMREESHEGTVPRAATEVTTTTLPACVHRVVDAAEPRLSISFELRVPYETQLSFDNMIKHCFPNLRKT